LYLRYPEIASVGLTEKQAKEKDELKLVNSVLSFRKAKASGTRRFCKSNFDAKYGEWLGCHMIGAGVTDMIAEAIVARKLETTGHEI
jgi:dihydrolipoamide dehydrogenase